MPIFFIDTGMLALGVGMFPTGRDGVVMELDGKLAFKGGMEFTQIWTGSCSTGDTITVPDILKYRFYAVRFESSDGTTSVANYVLCARYGTTYIRGSGGFPTNSAMVFYGVNFIIDGTKLTATAIAYQAMGGTYTPRTINVIYGIF